MSETAEVVHGTANQESDLERLSNRLDDALGVQHVALERISTDEDTDTVRSLYAVRKILSDVRDELDAMASQQ